MRLPRFLTRTRRRSSLEGASRNAGAPLVELDRWQLTGLLFAVLVIAVVAFWVGLSAGRKASAPGPERAPIAALAHALPSAASTQDRQMALAEVWPPTGGIDDSLSRPIAQPLPSDPTERARAQAHIQLQEARSIGLRDDAPLPYMGGGSAPPTVTPQAPAGGGGGYTLQISLFDTQAAAQAIASQLESSGTAVRIRQVRTADQRDLFRVEVGEFQTSDTATTFQRRFERETGYSGVLISL